MPGGASTLPKQRIVNPTTAIPGLQLQIFLTLIYSYTHGNTLVLDLKNPIFMPMENLFGKTGLFLILPNQAFLSHAARLSKLAFYFMAGIAVFIAILAIITLV